ncbi:MAG: ATP-binding protein [Actinobacteria bacterium]|nr:ATP-binding protein [Actinomycetota bacterium]
MLAKTESIAIIGTDAHLVEIEVDVSGGLPGFTIVGLPTKSVREAEQRTRSAIEASGRPWVRQRVVANLAPGGLRKDGTHFDLPLALGLLAGARLIDGKPLEGWVIIGELALNGTLRPVRGALAAAMACRSAGRRGLVCPASNAPEAALVDGIEVVPVTTLDDCIRWLAGELDKGQVAPAGVADEDAPAIEDLCEVRGHQGAKRAAEVAAAGGHNLMLVGPPGSGKTMLARRLPGILPPMSLDESLEVTRISSVAGMLTDRPRLVRERPFRSPHQHVSVAGLVGGGTGLPRPGEISLAHASIATCSLKE